MPFIPSRDAIPFVFRARRLLRLSQEQLGALLGVSRRTVIRWNKGSAPTAAQVITLAKAVYAKDRDLAAALARAAGVRLDEIGLEPSPAVAAAAQSVVTRAVLVDAIVCAAAGAAGSTPQAARAAVLAALERAAALGVSPADLAAALRPAVPAPPPPPAT